MTVVDPPAHAARRADYVIIGAGAAGCVLAERLSRSGRHNIILIEAGPRDDHPYIRMPKGLGQLAAKPAFNWAFQVDAQGSFPGEIWPRGRTLGGSTSTNGFIYNRGRPEDYDALEEAGCTGWNWASLGPRFEELENHALGPGPVRGHDGPLHLSMPTPHRLYDAIIHAGTELGLEAVEDLNAPERFAAGAIGLLPQTIHRGRRWSAARAFLDRAARRANVTVLTSLRADHLLFDKRRVVGVHCRGEQRMDIYANVEVIVTTGAIGSPLLLQRSGIGPANILREAGIMPVVDSPDVGANLVEHRNAYLQFRMRDPEFSQNRDHRGWRLIRNVLLYGTARRGMMAAGPCEVGAFVRADPSSERIDTQLLLMPVSMGPVAPGSSRISVEHEPGITIIAYQLRPTSRGSVSLVSRAPDAPARITANYLSTEEDRSVAIAATHFIRRMLGGTSLAGLVECEVGPLASAQSDEEIVKGWLRYGGPGCHAAGTCRMGIDPSAVVDPQMRVNGVSGLRVFDNSVFPFILSGNTAAPVMAGALHAANIIEAAAEQAAAA